MSVEYGGKTVFGANIGIMMLETQFPAFTAILPMPTHGIFQCNTGLCTATLWNWSVILLRRRKTSWPMAAMG